MRAIIAFIGIALTATVAFQQKATAQEPALAAGPILRPTASAIGMPLPVTVRAHVKPATKAGVGARTLRQPYGPLRARAKIVQSKPALAAAKQKSKSYTAIRDFGILISLYFLVPAVLLRKRYRWASAMLLVPGLVILGGALLVPEISKSVASGNTYIPIPCGGL